MSKLVRGTSQVGQFCDRALREEAEMVWTRTKEGLGYMLTLKRCRGWNCLVGEKELPVRRERGGPRRRFVMDVNCEGG